MKLLKTKKDKKQFLMWIDWLKVDVLPQTTGKLQDEKGYCCLGVAMVLCDPHPRQHPDTSFLKGSTPIMNFSRSTPKWLLDINTNFCNKTGTCITVLNDKHKLRFPEIADRLLEAYKDEIQ